VVTSAGAYTIRVRGPGFELDSGTDSSEQEETMEAKNVQHPRGPLGAVSRRSVLKGAAVLATARRARAAAKGVVLAYGGTYTPDGQGIHRFQVDLSTGALTQEKIFPSTTNPS